MKRPPERWSIVAAAMAMVGALRTKMLEMLVPRRMREVWTAQAASTANWSPPWPSVTQALSYPRSSASFTHSTISGGVSPPLKAGEVADAELVLRGRVTGASPPNQFDRRLGLDPV